MTDFILTLRALARGFAAALRDPETHVLFALFGFLLAVGSAFYVIVEGWGVIDAQYFCMASPSTVGYGDLAPQTRLGKLFTMGCLLLGTGAFVALVARIATSTVAQRLAIQATAQSRHGADGP